MEHLRRSVPAFLLEHDCPGTAEHSARVAREARRLALLAGADPDAAEAAGWLHDIGGIIPAGERVAAARAHAIPLLPEEEEFPLIIHQKLSVILAREQFGITDAAILSAIGCHTTLRPGSSLLDRVVYLADKIEWDGKDAAPYREEVLRALGNSFDEALRCYLQWVHGQRERLRVVHPWLRAAYEELTGSIW